MKLVGNSVSVPVIEILGKAIIETGVFDTKPGNVSGDIIDYQYDTVAEKIMER